MNLQDKQSTFSLNVSRLIAKIFDLQYSCSLGEAYRTTEQAELYAQQGKGIKDSLHCKRLAIDINLFSSDKKYLSDTKDYEQFGIFWESLHPQNRWGGRFKRADGNHFEMMDE